MFENCAPFTKCINKINNTHIDNSKSVDEVMMIHQLYMMNDNVIDFPASNKNSALFKDKRSNRKGRNKRY